MKLQAISAPAVGGAGEEGEEENEYNMARAVLQTAQRKLVSQVRSLIKSTTSTSAHYAIYLMDTANKVS